MFEASSPLAKVDFHAYYNSRSCASIYLGRVSVDNVDHEKDGLPNRKQSNGRAVVGVAQLQCCLEVRVQASLAVQQCQRWKNPMLTGGGIRYVYAIEVVEH